RGGGEQIVIVVEDEGVGLDARQRERVFDEFFTTKAGGSGLGLAFVRRVAQAHGGEADLTSKVDVGTRVWIAFPRLLAGRTA
ncbi:MAG: sensor histidine kinase, partial [Planctomycetota bacterium]|nr:sensor histidine kinase [Planctomycetota bacterium]